MKNLFDYIKDKIYYILGATILIIIILVVISACSSNEGGSYSSIENKMVSAAKSYYNNRKDNLPKEDGNSVKVTIGTLVDAELLDEIKDPNNKEQTCNGYVQVKKVKEEYIYVPFLTCKGNYEPKYLNDIVKNSKLDEYGNGVYEMSGEYVYRGDEIKNYIMFADKLWRIVLVDKEGDTEIVLNTPTDEYYNWETSFNTVEQENVGINTDYFNTDIRKALVRYYDENFSSEDKAKIVPKNLCVGALGKKEDFNREKECSKIQENEYIGLLRVSDFQRATTDNTCVNRSQGQCKNHNYLVDSAYISSWLLNVVEDNTYQVFNGYGVIIKDAADNSSINPVVYLSRDVIIVDGTGEKNNPFIIK